MITIALLGPSLTTVSGVSTHLNQLFYSSLAKKFNLLHFQVGSEGRNESGISKLLRFIFSPIHFFWWLILNRPQIVHLNTSLESKSYWRDAAYLFIARIMGKKIVYQVHGGELPQKFFSNSKFLTKFLRFILRSADIVVLLSQEELSAYREFAPNLHLEVIPNAIDVSEDAEWKCVIPTQDRPLKLAYVGRLVRSKGIFEIIGASKILCDHGKNIQLVIAGSGPEEANLHAYVQDFGLVDNVSFVGAVFGEEKKQVWEQADLFVFPTYHPEGLPYTLLESMAARTPPVISPVGAIPDVIKDGVHGIFVPSRNPQVLADTIEQLDNNRELICRMGEAGRQRVVDYYTVTRLAKDFHRVYHNLMS
ncbi:MAG: glycosyltransferase family 4 protein [Gammaproteobacteria bacterium]|nr:MAG: glycosyltransferase family 4 protein [Gammaproteobacteria bacterium]